MSKSKGITGKPENPKQGDIFFNKDNDKLFVFNGLTCQPSAIGKPTTIGHTYTCEEPEWAELNMKSPYNNYDAVNDVVVSENVSEIIRNKADTIWLPENKLEQLINYGQTSIEIGDKKIFISVTPSEDFKKIKEVKE